ncbi:MAG: hypothetical protein DDT23_00930 [candidate division WS2 bacterium]|nr:hypothetical protein [Candidatus Lithacetigena glycinireducens]
MGKNKVYICSVCGQEFRSRAASRKRGLDDIQWFEICSQCIVKMLRKALLPGEEDSSTSVFDKHPHNYKEPKSETNEMK